MRFTSGRRVIAVVIAGAAIACRVPKNHNDENAVAIAVQRSLDSCDAPAPAARDGRGRAVLGAARLTGAVRAFQMFSLFVPDSAHVAVTDSGFGGLTLSWPGCVGCRFGVVIQRDSGIGLEARVARTVAAQRTIDSINRDPRTVVHEFDDIDGPPQPFTTTSGRGYLIDNDCGDCAATSLWFGRPGYVAEVGLGGDDDVPDIGRRLCEMSVIGKTFVWRPQGPGS